jgi:hypothetical protein
MPAVAPPDLRFLLGEYPVDRECSVGKLQRGSASIHVQVSDGDERVDAASIDFVAVLSE